MEWQELAHEAAEHQLRVNELLGKAVERGLRAGASPDQVVHVFMRQVASGRTDLLDVPDRARPVLTALVMAEGLLSIAKGLIRVGSVEGEGLP